MELRWQIPGLLTHDNKTGQRGAPGSLTGVLTPANSLNERARINRNIVGRGSGYCLLQSDSVARGLRLPYRGRGMVKPPTEGNREPWALLPLTQRRS